METVLGTFRDGQVVLEHAVDWPNGAPLEVRLGTPSQSASPQDGEERCFDGSCPPSTPAEIEEWLKWFNTIEPFDWNAAERSRFEQALHESDEISKADMLKQWSVDGASA